MSQGAGDQTVYVDAVINHMTGPLQLKKGTAGSSFKYDEYSYPAVPYVPDDFHTKRQCGSKSMVRNCELLGLRDLNHTRQHVRAKISEFLNQVISLGVAGFRVDAAKHMWTADLKVTYAKLNNLSTEFFTAGAMPFIYQEVIDMDQGEPITRWDYNQMGRVPEFNYGAKLVE
ncbi:alpha-amylase-like [Rhipicephalus microplus]|uniref:alpha-amylase-like n=1 Tax=Rhipicephalus microplus TaxID=6941 RepID=UPI003F6AB02B